MLPRTRLEDISPLEFCRRIKSLDTGLSIESVALREERGIFKEYCRLLSRELEVPFSTIQKEWGAGIEFPKMPPRMRKMLKYVLKAREVELRERRIAS